MQKEKGGSTGAAALQLQKELRDIMNDRLNDYCNVLLETDNIFEWSVFFLGPKGTDYEGGVFKCKLEFPPNYPFEPPTMRFCSDFWHPNVYKDGKVCISILHTPDPMNPEENGQYVYLRNSILFLVVANWTPAQRVETIIVSVISMLSDPNFSSPANIDASVELRKDPQSYKARVRKIVEKSKAELPPGFEMPKVKPLPKLQESVSDLLLDDDDFAAYDQDVDDDDDAEPEEDDE